MLISQEKKEAILQPLLANYQPTDKVTIFRIEMQHGNCTMLCPGGVEIEKAVTSALIRFGEERVLRIEPQ